MLVADTDTDTDLNSALGDCLFLEICHMATSHSLLFMLLWDPENT
jgi:hypothetical protein